MSDITNQFFHEPILHFSSSNCYTFDYIYLNILGLLRLINKEQQIIFGVEKYFKKSFLHEKNFQKQNGIRQSPPFIYLSIYLSVCLSIYLFNLSNVSNLICLVCLSVCLSVSVFLSVCLSIYLYTHKHARTHTHTHTHTHIYIYIYIYIGCPKRNVPDFGRVFLMLKYTDITQNTYIQS